MPTISMFFGIIVGCILSLASTILHISMSYNEYKASVDIRMCEIIVGNLPKRQQKLVLAWAELHQEELMADWNLVKKEKKI